VGQPEKFSAEGQKGCVSAGGFRQSQCGFSWGEALQPDARVETDPGAQSGRKGAGKEAKLSYSGNLLVENVRECRNMGMTPHVAQNLGRRGGSAIDSRTTRYTGYAIGQKKRKRIEECFGWLKTIALLRKLRHRGTLKVDGSLPSRAQPTTWCGCET
jgi:hypothetical protein